MKFTRTVTPLTITLHMQADKGGFLSRLLPASTHDLEALPPSARDVALALADVRALADETNQPLEISGDTIRLSHQLAASLDAATGALIGLPAFTDLTLTTDAKGVIGSPDFKLSCIWSRAGQQRLPTRTGSILKTDRGEQRIPLWMMEALDVAEAPLTSDDATHWEALARFRRALDPGVRMAEDSRDARLSMTSFLAGLEVSLADRFAISPTANGDDFEVIPFSRRSLEDMDDLVTEAMGELTGPALQTFQHRLRERGPVNAFSLGQGRFMVIDRSAAPALRVMAEMQKAPAEERRAFMRNPRPRIAAALEESIRDSGLLDGMTEAGQEEAIEKAALPTLVETQEYADYSERVTGIGIYQKPNLAPGFAAPMTWLPELFSKTIASGIEALAPADLQVLRADVQKAIESGQKTIPFAGDNLPANDITLGQIDAMLARTVPDAPEIALTGDGSPGQVVVAQTTENFEEVAWKPLIKQRLTLVPDSVPKSIRTTLQQHQVESLHWQIQAWKAGLPGVLNADEQGLGKTLQTIAFLVWLNETMARGPADNRRAILVVAPTSLLENWEQEVARHVEAPGLGHLIRLYGGGIGARKKTNARGVDIATGEARLDFDDLSRAQAVGAGHMTWILTTYTTLTNYQHSIGRLPLAAVVFDEIQAVKNPVSLRAVAARAAKADFRIGLTGTPIENTTLDLWAIMDQLAPGYLGSLSDFRTNFETPDEANMQRLHDRVFCNQGTLPPLALRRIKDDVAKDLPKKSRRLYPRLMPAIQASVYEQAREKLANGGPGAALKMLHHIRSVSVHPTIEGAVGPAFIAASARLTATFEILRRIRDAQQRALVFIEHRQMQYRFVELVRAELGVAHIDLINGDTPIQKRQAIVNRFQRHLVKDEGFDLLVLGPKAAGTGLTLTAATHVIHLSRWWNPAVEEQCNDRVHRIGQTSPVTVYVPMSIHPDYREGSFDCLLQSLMQRKRRLASSALWPMGDTQGDADNLQKMVANGASSDTSIAPVDAAMLRMFERDSLTYPILHEDGSWPCDD